VYDRKARGPQHCLHTSPIRYPPVRFIMGVTVFHKVQARVTRIIEDCGLAESIIIIRTNNLAAASLHALKQHPVLGYMLMDQVKRQQRMAKVIKHAHEHYEIKCLAERCYIPHSHLYEFDIYAFNLRSKPGLPQIALIGIDAKHSFRSPSLHLQAIESGIAANIQNCFAGQSFGMASRKFANLTSG